jgi:hypothetical protein
LGGVSRGKDIGLSIFRPPFLDAQVPIVGFNTTLASVFRMEVPPVFCNLIPRTNGGWTEPWRFSLGVDGLSAAGLSEHQPL